ncbi:hypothetical protein [Aquimarina rubra]|uniref:Uncharacterized protein n=1 Tax=Aquimarina rubra TaxID=1920033 RepID=A0ABW5LNA2_9FLAO
MTIFLSSLIIKEKSVEMVLFDELGDAINKGSKSFCQSILSYLNLNAIVKSWDIVVCRTDYFSDFIGESDWADNWQIVWKLKIYTSEINTSEIKLPDVFIGLDLDDDSWIFSERVTENDTTNCVVICNFLYEANRTKASEAIFNYHSTFIKNEVNIEIPVFLKLTILDKYYQLIIDLGNFKPNFYKNGAEYAKTVQNICKEFGGLPHYSLIE